MSFYLVYIIGQGFTLTEDGNTRLVASIFVPRKYILENTAQTFFYNKQRFF